MKALICGSLAFDNIMTTADRFASHILPEQIEILNVCFLVPELRREFGGCAGNIAYNLHLLGGDGMPMATVGRDFGPYAEWMSSLHVDESHIRVLDGPFTAQAFVTTDSDSNQITAFYPGAMNESHLNDVGDATGVTLGVVAPDGQEGMVQHAEQFAAAGIPFLFDPGQQLPLFSGDELRRFIDRADWVAVNAYEWEMLQQRTGYDARAMTERLRALIVTYGADGSRIFTDREVFDIPPAEPSEVCDPTGCGDAYRAGLLYGLMHDMDWQTTGRVASLMGAIKVARPGTQNHRLEPGEAAHRFERAFGYAW